MKYNNVLFAATLIGSSLLMTSSFAATNTQHTSHQVAVSSNKAVGTVTMNFHSADIGIGYTWGDGVLHYRGHIYKFKIKGGDVVALGFSKSQASGRVFQLKNIYDFAGKYAAATGEATAGVGVGAGNLKNAKDVIIKMDTNTVGGRIAGAPAGFEIKFVDKHLQKAAEANKEKDKNIKKTSKNSHMTADDLNNQQLEKMKK